jgi:8-oxo-dGTP pyrophosphatase MutT (NUDIX family)
MQREAVAKVLVFNEKGQLLLMHIGEHSEKPERSYTPDLPGGMVDPGESEHAAAVREVMEEAGIALNPDEVTLAYAKTEAYPSESKSVSKLVYIVQLKNTPEVTVSWEHESYEWVEFSSVRTAYPLQPFHDEAVSYVQSNHLI